MSAVSQTELVNGTTLVLGGARSGKSAFAENLILNSGLKPHYIATAQIWDDEMRARVDLHKDRRNETWTNIEAPDDLEAALREADNVGNAILVDCLTLWVSNLMMAEVDIKARTSALIDALLTINAPVVLVSNEVGLGIVPDNQMARQFRDYAGELHQAIAKTANEVYFIAAGLPLKMKG